MQNNIPPVPETIEQLQAWYYAHNLPPEEVTRFFIGKDIKEPRAFGIYRDGRIVVVYKNKDDGSRAVRYSGFDEKHAVNEIYTKLKIEIAKQQANNIYRQKRAQMTPQQLRNERIRTIAVFVLIAALIVGGYILLRDPQKSGYYNIGRDWYYYNSGAWYYYDNYYNDWYAYDNGYEAGYWDGYYVSDRYNSSYGPSNFELTDYYRDTDTSSTWDSGDSWDSGTMDFASDW